MSVCTLKCHYSLLVCFSGSSRVVVEVLYAL
jgi:hypothetical protein